MANNNRIELIRGLVASSIDQLFSQYKAVNEKSNHQLDLSSIHTVIRYNGVAGLHVHSGAKLTINLHAEVSEKDNGMAAPSGSWRNDKVQI